MKRILSCSLFLLLITAPLTRGQGSTAGGLSQEAEENYKRLVAQVETLKEAQEGLAKQVQALKAENRELKEQISKPQGNYATHDDLKRVADASKDAIEKVDKNRQSDNEKVMAQLKKIAETARTAAAVPVTPRGSGARTELAPAGPREEPGGFKYEVKENDTPTRISRKLFEEKGVKISADQILKANPGVTATNLKVGQIIYIPPPTTPAAAR